MKLSKPVTPDKINNEKKYLRKHRSQGDLFPNVIDKDNNIVYLQDFNKDKFSELLRFNTNLILIYPEDFESFSNVTSENKMLSKVVTGINQIPNPKINSLEARLRRAQQEMIIAERNIQAGLQQNLSSYDPYAAGQVF